MTKNPGSYHYYIHKGNDEIIGDIEVPAPLPHIEVGNQLLFNSDHGEGWLEITHVRVQTSFLKGAFQSYNVYVFGEHHAEGLPPDRA